jgi:hypothetical protein
MTVYYDTSEDWDRPMKNAKTVYYFAGYIFSSVEAMQKKWPEWLWFQDRDGNWAGIFYQPRTFEHNRLSVNKPWNEIYIEGWSYEVWADVIEIDEEN